MTYHVELSPEPRKALAKLPKTVAARIIGALEELAINPRPRGCVKLKGFDTAYRVRIGDYRVVYEIYDDRLIVYVARIAHRKDVYRD